jgi:type IV secretory pathway protease TraF
MIDLNEAVSIRELPAEVDREMRLSGTNKAIKRVACAAGAFLENRGNDYFCAGRYVGTAKDRSRGGGATHKYQHRDTIPIGYVFVTGDHADSYDSKYFGLVNTKDIESVLYPVF